MNDEVKIYFENYISIGLKPILLHAHSKKPLIKKWNSKYDSQKWRDLFEKCEERLNIGVLLGDIIDVEADTQESNEFLENLIGTYPHPFFQSSRSIHHLFLNPDITLTAVKFRDIEFRANNVQSVFPPSIHSDGSKYKFLKNSSFPIPPMPEALLKFYWENRKNHKIQQIKIKKRNKKIELKENFAKSYCHKCKKNIIIHKKRLFLEVKAFSAYHQKWMCHKCRNINVSEDCRNIKNQIRLR